MRKVYEWGPGVTSRGMLLSMIDEMFSEIEDYKKSYAGFAQWCVANGRDPSIRGSDDTGDDSSPCPRV